MDVKTERCCPEGTIRKDGKCVLPDVTFSTLVISLSTSVLYHLGEVPDPQTGGKNTDLILAKHAIDTLRLLQEKTKGNLTDEEQKLLEGILYDLRLRFVQAKAAA